MKFWLALLFTLMPIVASAQNWAPIVDPLHKSVLRMEMASILGAGGCSSVVYEITPDKWAKALTAAHCVHVEPFMSLNITVDDRAANVVAINTILDLAIVQFRPSRSTTPIVLAVMNPPAGTPIAVAGFGFGVEEIAFQFGHVSQTHNRETKAMWVNLDVLFGDSGGAIVDESGRLVGITSYIWSQNAAHIGGAIPIETVRDFIDAYGNNK